LSELAAYVIQDERLKLNIVIRDIESLHVHEKVIPQFLEQLVRSIKADGCIKHPVIVDKNSLVVLDGVHRIAALEKLGVKRIPVCLVDYNSPNIKVCSWYRTIIDASKPEGILAQVRKTNGIVKEIEELDESIIGIPPAVAAIKFRNQTFLVNSSFQNLREAYDIIKRIEENMKAGGLRVKHETERDALQSLKENRVDAVLCTPKLTKQEIVKAAVSGQVFTSKATRHIIPARPLNINVPLSLLRDDKNSLAKVNEELNRMLQKRRLRRVPSGSLLEGRRYEEELYIFEE